MTKEELAREVSDRTGVSRKVARSVLVSLLDVITEQLCEGDSIYLRGFGCFQTREGRRRRARDPQGNGIIEIPPKIRPVFRPYNELKESVQQSLGSRVRVDFLCLTARNAERVSVVGSFNNWEEGSTPMQRLPDGSWVAEIEVVSGQTLRYRYCVDGRMEPDPAFPSDSRGNTLRQV